MIRKIEYKKIAKSLCAVFLAVGMLMTSCRLAILAADEPDGNVGMHPGARASDKYNVTVEFGSLQFYYDWGEWSPETHDYVTSPSSTMPAKGGTAGKPGWYGFDGDSNKITIINESDGKEIYANIWFDTVSKNPGESAFPLKQNSVTMSLYQDSAFSTEVETQAAFKDVVSGYVLKVSSNTKASPYECYLSLSGKPQLTSGEPYVSQAAMPIGYLSVSIATAESEANAKTAFQSIQAIAASGVVFSADPGLSGGTTAEITTAETTTAETTTAETTTAETTTAETTTAETTTAETTTAETTTAETTTAETTTAETTTAETTTAETTTAETTTAETTTAETTTAETTTAETTTVETTTVETTIVETTTTETTKVPQS